MTEDTDRRIAELERRVAFHERLAAQWRARALAAEAEIDRPWWKRVLRHRPACEVAAAALAKPIPTDWPTSDTA